METRDWIIIAIAAITLISSWGQFWVKESLLTSRTTENDVIDKLFRSKRFLSLMAFTGAISGVSIWFLVSEVMSIEPITRSSSFSISALTVLSVLNIILIQSLFTLRRLAVLSHEMKVSQATQMAFAASN